MSNNVLRKVFGFAPILRREIMPFGTVCISCKRELATELDHILSLDFHNHAEKIGVVMNHSENALPLCGKCHNSKNKSESFLDLEDVKGITAHWSRWYRVAFTPKGKRRTFRKATKEKTKTTIARIHRARCLIRKLKIQKKSAATPEIRESIERTIFRKHQLIAKIRREN
jgi:TPP-dependent trihydroxycyclohexane-1,2-dione (THcHDO) dehydratase